MGTAGAFADNDVPASAAVSVSDSPRLKSLFLTPPTPQVEGRPITVVIILTGPVRRLDHNTNGQLSPEVGVGRGESSQRFKTLDADHDGFLNAPVPLVFDPSSSAAKK